MKSKPVLEQPLLLSVEQVAALLGVKTRTVWRLWSSGELPPPAKLRGLTRARRSDVEEYINRVFSNSSSVV